MPDSLFSGWWGPLPPPRWATEMYTAVVKHLTRIERKIMSAQEDIDQITADLGRIGSEITAEIDALEAQVAAGQPGDFSALRAKVAGLDDLAPAVEAPVEPPVDPNA